MVPFVIDNDEHLLTDVLNRLLDETSDKLCRVGTAHQLSVHQSTLVGATVFWEQTVGNAHPTVLECLNTDGCLPLAECFSSPS